MAENEVKDRKDVAKEPSPSNGGDSGVTKFLKDTKIEFEKVVWPTRQQLISESAAVLLMVVAAASLISLVDALFGFIASQVFQ